MKKKTILLCVLCLLTMSLVACGKEETTKEQTTEEQNTESLEPEFVKTVELGETITTDIFEITLKDAALAEALDNTEGRVNGKGNGNQLGLPKTWDANEDAGNPWVAPRGCSLVYMDLVIKNNDRTSYDLPVRELIKGVKYKDKYYSTEDFILSSASANNNILLDLAYFGSNGWEKSEPVTTQYPYAPYSAGFTYMHRYALGIDEVDSLNDTVEIFIGVPDTEGIKYYKYVVN